MRALLPASAMVSCLLAFASLPACSSGASPGAGAKGAAATVRSTRLVVVRPEAPGAHCAAGGQAILQGDDASGDGALQPEEVQSTVYVCNGVAGGAGASGKDGAPGSAGPAGADGSKGADGARGTSGAPGAPGADGASGKDGLTSLVAVSDEPPGPNCIAGGKRVAVGQDDNRNGSLDAAEITATAFACNGVDGAPGRDGDAGRDGVPGRDGDAGRDGVPGRDGDAGRDGVPGRDGDAGRDGAPGLVSLVSVSDEPAGPRCAAGGKRIDTGIDLDRSGVLDPAEILSSQYVCNGTAGAPGRDGRDGESSLVSVSDEPPGAKCAAGGKRIDTGVDENRNGALDADEIRSTQYLCLPVPPAPSPVSLAAALGSQGPVLVSRVHEISDGSVFFVGEPSALAGSTDVQEHFIARVDAAGVERWRRRFGVATGAYFNVETRLDDARNALVFYGASAGEVTLDSRPLTQAANGADDLAIFSGSISADGVVQFVRSERAATRQALALGPDGSIYTVTAPSSEEMIVERISATGQLVFRRRLRTNPLPNGRATIPEISVSASGAVVLSYGYGDSSGKPVQFTVDDGPSSTRTLNAHWVVLRYEADGALRWAYGADATGYSHDPVLALEDGGALFADSLWAKGRFPRGGDVVEIDATSFGTVVGRIDATGSLAWIVRAGSWARLLPSGGFVSGLTVFDKLTASVMRADGSAVPLTSPAGRSAQLFLSWSSDGALFSTRSIMDWVGTAVDPSTSTRVVSPGGDVVYVQPGCPAGVRFGDDGSATSVVTARDGAVCAARVSSGGLAWLRSIGGYPRLAIFDGAVLAKDDSLLLRLKGGGDVTVDDGAAGQTITGSDLVLRYLPDGRLKTVVGVYGSDTSVDAVQVSRSGGLLLAGRLGDSFIRPTDVGVAHLFDATRDLATVSLPAGRAGAFLFGLRP